MVPVGVERVTASTTTMPEPVAELALNLADTPILTLDVIAEIYTRNGPIAVVPGVVSEGDAIVLETACRQLVEASDEKTRALVYETFESWFEQQLAAVGASLEYIEAWHPSGMLDELASMGCVPPVR